MAGVLLLQNKTSQSLDNFNKKTDRIKRYALNKFSPHFKKIQFKQPSDNTFLMLFQKDNNEKFSRDNEGNWLAFEGVVYALNETKKFNAKELLEFYKMNKDDFPNLLDGHFVIKLYDSRRCEILVLNDFIKNKTNF